MQSRSSTRPKSLLPAIALLLAVVVLVLGQIQLAYPQTTEGSVVILPPSIDVWYLNDFTVDIQIQNVANMTWFSFRVNFDHNLISWVVGGYAYSPMWSGGCMQETPGQYYCSASYLDSAFSGTSTVLTVTFHCLAGGSSSISIGQGAGWIKLGHEGEYYDFAQLGTATVNQIVPSTVTATSNVTTTSTSTTVATTTTSVGTSTQTIVSYGTVSQASWTTQSYSTTTTSTSGPVTYTSTQTSATTVPLTTVVSTMVMSQTTTSSFTSILSYSTTMATTETRTVTTGLATFDGELPPLPGFPVESIALGLLFGILLFSFARRRRDSSTDPIRLGLRPRAT